MEQKKIVISKWAKANSQGQMLQQVVIKTPTGKKKNGKQAYTSQTKHVPV